MLTAVRVVCDLDSARFMDCGLVLCGVVRLLGCSGCSWCLVLCS